MHTYTPLRACVHLEEDGLLLLMFSLSFFRRPFLSPSVTCSRCAAGNALGGSGPADSPGGQWDSWGVSDARLFSALQWGFSLNLFGLSSVAPCVFWWGWVGWGCFGRGWKEVWLEFYVQKHNILLEPLRRSSMNAIIIFQFLSKISSHFSSKVFSM